MDNIKQAPPLVNCSDGGVDMEKPYLDADALKLASMGYTQDMKRNFSVWSVLGVGFSLTNSWFGISAALVTGINSGGPLLPIYGIIIVTLISTCVGISLSELASAYPNAGGQYFWANELASPKWANFASYATGWAAWVGSIFTSASVNLAVGSALVGCWQLSHPDFVILPWHVFVAYQCVNLFAYIFNCYGKTLPIVASMALYTSLISFAVILITVPAVAPTHQTAKFVFATFINNTGWSQNGIAFIVGLVNVNWAFACLDCATHLAEEVHRPEKMIPIAIMGTVGIGFVTSWFFSISMFFSIVGDFSLLTGTTTLVPILELFYQAMSNKAGAIVLESLIIATGIGCEIASHTWQSRLCWSFARDRGLPGHRYLSRVHPGSDVPLYAHTVSCLLVAIVGCLYLGSYTAFNSMVTACIVLLYISYSIPVACLLLRGRSTIKPGPFWLGPIGLFANIVLLAWSVFTIIMYSFPYAMPVAASNMNYVSAVYAVVAIIMSVDWFVRGKKSYRSQSTRRAEVEVLIGREGSVADVKDVAH
ncbi:choline transport protein [Pseudovirgaria hyperparasitica]|uniref:Choline transport protein n=1 Tax=Pseudovirgaria hyperparasitica TaxID=470096 RepID=A0A6A6WJ43_9PEZI|nr:choline transport protein [Pseudovirgaria hyperparasitica]KAF2762399.1 choline transport protein [Pseudovirgaria hyperparasitica]